MSAVRSLDVGVIRDKARALLFAARDSVEVCRYDAFYSAVLLLADTSVQFLPTCFNDEAFYKTYGVEVKNAWSLVLHLPSLLTPRSLSWLMLLIR